jgi:hypothetical protein
MPFILALFLAASFPSSSQTSWMRPEAFHLTVGMSRADAIHAITDLGLKPQKGDDDRHVIVDYTPTKSLTLEFSKARLRSIRFEYFTMTEEIGGAFDEQKKFLRETFGNPKPIPSKSMLIYDSTLPNVMAVVTNNPRKHLGTLVVRYYDPAGGTK